MNDFRVRQYVANRLPAGDYDVNVMVLCHYRGVYRDRVPWFKLLGLVNRGRLRIHVTVVCSLGDGPFLEEIVANWPAGIDVTALEMESNKPVPKLNGAYLWLREHPVQCRWTLRVDDDSVTDIGGLLVRQETRFGRSAVHIMNSPHAVPVDDRILVDIRKYLVDHDLPVFEFTNEYEAALTSAAGLQRVFDSPQACQFLAHTAAHLESPGDKCFTFASRIAGVPVAVTQGTSHGFDRGELSIAGGNLQHIHYVDWEESSFRKLLWAFEYGVRTVVPPEHLDALCGGSFQFGRGVGEPLAVLTLREDGRLTGTSHSNEARWRATADALHFENDLGQPTTVFDTLLTGRHGRWLIGPSIVTPQHHYLNISR